LIRTHPDDPPLTIRETAEIGRITALAMIRGGILTTRQQNKIDRIIGSATERAAKAKKESAS
jgi:hypothetical protein